MLMLVKPDAESAGIALDLGSFGDYGFALAGSIGPSSEEVRRRIRRMRVDKSERGCTSNPRRASATRL